MKSAWKYLVEIQDILSLYSEGVIGDYEALAMIEKIIGEQEK